MLWIFWVSSALIRYVFIGYGVCLWLLSMRYKRIRLRKEIYPTVSVLIAIRGGEDVIEAKIRNCLELDYPREKIDITVICDGLPTNIESKTESFAKLGVKVISAKRGGKNHCLAIGLAATSGELVMFTDIGVMADPLALRNIVSNFADGRVGCVSSEDSTKASGGNAEATYVSFDSVLRRLESAVGSSISASGALFVARRSLCEPWPEALSSDFFIPLQCIEAGLDAIVDSRVHGSLSAVSPNAELRRKVRTIVHGLDVLICYRRMLNPFKHPLAAWELASRKLLRWLLPLVLMAMFISSCLLFNAGSIYRWATIIQEIAYLMGLIPWIFRRSVRITPFAVAHFVILGNIATICAWVLYARGNRFVTWKPSVR